MFTGIIEATGKIIEIIQEKTNYHFSIKSEIAKELKIDQSVSHNGACLTVTFVAENLYKATAIQETLQKTNLGDLKPGDLINLERCMQMNGRIDGHIVQGHIDQIGFCKKVENKDGSWVYDFEYDSSLGNFTVEKGSICVNGVSLTLINSGFNTFSVAIIPYTFQHTNFHTIHKGSKVNLEFDIIGKYVQKILANLKN